VELCRGSALDYLRRFGFRSDLVVAMYAVTDGLPGLSAGPDAPGSGHNLLVHNMCRLPGADGTWMVVRGGMGTVTRRLADLASAAGAAIRTGARVERVRARGGAVEGVTLAGGEEVDAAVVVSGADPFRTMAMAGDVLPEDYRARVAAMRRDGATLKLNLCLEDLPRFTCRPDDPRVFGPTIHLLPDEEVVMDEIARAHADAAAGRLPAEPPIEWYVHTALDPSLRDGAGRHSAALFVHPVPYRLADSGWDREATPFAERLLALCDRFAPGTGALVREAQPLPPPGIEARFGMTGGHIHHVDNALGFAERLPYETPVEGLWCCGAGCHPAGSVIGAAGRNAAHLVLEAVA
jgi:phytoene dehydrogenase-like protein